MLKTGRILRLGFLSSALLAGQATSPLIRWEQLRILQQSPGPKKAAYSPDGKRLAIWRRVFENNTQTGCIIEFWDTRSWQIERTIRQQTTNGDVDLVWSPLSTHVAILSGWPSTAITIWDLQSRTVVQRLGGKLFRVNAIAWSPDAALIAKASEGAIEIWDAANGLQVRTLQSGARECHALAWSADSRQIGAACSDVGFGKPSPHDEFRIWDASSSRLAKSLAVPIGSGKGGYVAWSHDLTHVASLDSSGSAVLIYEMRGGRLGRTVPMKSEVASLAWSPDSRWIAAGHQQVNAISIWDAENGNHLAELRGGTLACWSPDTRSIASTGEDGSVRIWRRIDSPK